MLAYTFYLSLAAHYAAFTNAYKQIKNPNIQAKCTSLIGKFFKRNIKTANFLYEQYIFKNPATSWSNLSSDCEYLGFLKQCHKYFRVSLIQFISSWYLCNQKRPLVIKNNLSLINIFYSQKEGKKKKEKHLNNL